MATIYMHVWTSATATAEGDVEQSDSETIGVSSSPLSVITKNNTRGIKSMRLFADADCFIAIGENPTADSTGIPLGANNPEYFSIKVGQRVAVITRA